MSTGTGFARLRPITRPGSPRRLVLLAAVGAVVVGGVTAFLLTRSSGSDHASSPVSSGAATVGHPQILTAGELRTFAAHAPGPIYWAGPAGRAARLEVTTTSDGNVFVRYLTGRAQAGDPRPAFTTVGTYGLTHAYKVVSADSRAKGASRVLVPGGGIATSNVRTPDSYYVAFPHENFVAEVYATSPQHARRLVTSGRIIPVR